MCIAVNPNYAAQPDGSVRFKLMKLNNDGTVDGLNHRANGRYAHGISAGDEHAVGDVRRASGSTSGAGDPSAFGIHVCTDEAEFEKVRGSYEQGAWTCRFAKVKVECRGFLAGGDFDGAVNETWREVTILSIEEVPNSWAGR